MPMHCAMAAKKRAIIMLAPTFSGLRTFSYLITLKIGTEKYVSMM